MPNQTHEPDKRIDNWETAVQYLRAGNTRYLTNQPVPRDTHEQDRNILKDGQQPFAVIITCSDSRVAPEIYFDQKLGGIFVIRNAGNIADPTALGSIEFAVGYLHVPLVVVVGHSQCGAVIAAYGNNQSEYPANLQSIIDKIHASIDGAPTIETAVETNILKAVEHIQKNEMIGRTGAKVIGACYDIVTGKVHWL
ncbi:MAG: carbonic anhydrase [Peptococcaceae bacterium]|nr:carbonic anhydrase [Peptococcaceae bacterium]